jgi:hypothetical protein
MAQNTLPDEASPKAPLRRDAEPGVIGTYDAITGSLQTSGNPDGVNRDSLLYPEGERRSAWALFTTAFRAYFDDPAPWKVAEETQIAKITYASTINEAQDYRRMNEAQYTANVNRQRGPKVSERPGTGSIIGNLASGPSQLESGDNAILALLGAL